MIVHLPLRYMACFSSYGLASLIFSLSLAEEFQNDLNLLNELVKNKQPHSVILAKLSELIHYSSVKRSVVNHPEIERTNISIQFNHLAGSCISFQASQFIFGDNSDFINFTPHGVHFCNMPSDA